MNFERKKMKYTSIITIALFIPLLSQAALPAEISEVVPLIIAGPYLQNPTGDSMTIMWITDKNCTGAVEYGLDRSLGQNAVSVNDGFIQANTKIHKVTINDLKPDTEYHYKVTSTDILKFEPYKVTFGETVSSSILTFSTLNPKTKSISFIVLNDLHDKLDIAASLLDLENARDYDLVFLNGDIISDPQSEEQIVAFLKGITDLFAAEKPFILIRGNHETRGEWARDIRNYIVLPDDNFYYSFNFGPVNFTILDSGEDKEDSHWAYSGLNDFDSYRSTQKIWLGKHIKSPSFKKAPWRICLTHIPLFGSGDAHGTTDCREKWATLLNKGKIDLHISGHTHRYAMHEPTKQHKYPILIGGAPQKDRATLIRIDADQKKLSVSMTTDSGKTVHSWQKEKPGFIFGIFEEIF